MTPAVAAVRRWSVDWLNGQHPEVCEDVLSEGYTLRIGGFLLGPRETYVPATLAQLARYPGLCVTTHSCVTDGTHVAISFSEHGASARLEGRAAAWTGVSVFRFDGERLDACWAEEDYAGRRRQLAGGVADPVLPPATAPWDELPRPADPAAEQVVRDWLSGPDLRAVPVVCDDEHLGHPAERLLDVSGVEEHVLFSAGDQVAFHVAQTGTYLGGLEDCEGAAGRSAVLEVAGVVTVTGGRITGGRVVRDRLGTARALAAAASAA
ncbi:MAG: hypothetical protein JWN08_1791 [Frankiales bacterium]|nr:hypothetical protein [Frankiales bacterium]